MKIRTLCLALALAFTGPGVTYAQVPTWDLSISAFEGGALPFDTELKYRDGTVPADAKAKGVELKNSVSFGGKVDLWNTAFRPTFGFDFGGGIDVTHYTPAVKGGTGRITGTPGGVGFTGTGEVAGVDLDATIVAADLLARYPVWASPAFPNGRWYPYLGIGGGVDIARAAVGGASDTDTAPVMEALAGLNVFLTRHLALFGEYKFTRAQHVFYEDTTRLHAAVDTNHIVGGLALHF